MRKVRLPERVLDQIEHVVDAANGTVAGGLLIGTRIEVGYWIERILPCRNAASPEQSDRMYAVHPGAVENVRRTLATRQQAILGIFAGGGSIRPGDPAQLTVLDGESLHLAPTSNGDGRTPPRIWKAGTELPVEIVPHRESAIPYCPE